MLVLPPPLSLSLSLPSLSPRGYFPALLFNACSIASSLLFIESNFSNISVLTVANFLDSESRRSSTTAASSAGAPYQQRVTLLASIKAGRKKKGGGKFTVDLLLLASSALSPGVAEADLRCGALEGGGEGGDITWLNRMLREGVR